MKKIVIIEDDKILREELEILLNDSGYQAEILSDFTDAAAQVRQIRPDLVLLDIILPGANGQYILRQIREKSDVPVIMLTSKDGEVEEIMSRSSGADDYVTKPYNPTILLLRIETILRRTEQTGRQSEQRASSVRGEKAEGEAVQEELQDEELRLNLLKSTVSYHGDEVVLSKNELAILHCLMSRKGQIGDRGICYYEFKKIFKGSQASSFAGTAGRGCGGGGPMVVRKSGGTTGICFFLADREYRSDFWIRFPEKKKIL